MYKMIDIKHRLNQIFAEKFGLDQSSDLSDVSMASLTNWDSFSHMELMIELQDQFGLGKLDGDDLMRLVSYEKILKFLNEHRS